MFYVIINHVLKIKKRSDHKKRRNSEIGGGFFLEHHGSNLYGYLSYILNIFTHKGL